MESRGASAYLLKLDPSKSIEENLYDVYPPETLVTAGGTIEAFSEAVVENYKPLSRQLVPTENTIMLEIRYGD